MLVGCFDFAWGLRYALFAVGRPFALVLVGIALHGICFDFFFAAGFIHVENTAPKAIQASGQALFAVLTYGLGMFIGAQVAGNVFNRFLSGASALAPDQWQEFWYIPAAFALAVMVFFAATFKDKTNEA